jgi:hypothetical protein
MDDLDGLDEEYSAVRQMLGSTTELGENGSNA